MTPLNNILFLDIETVPQFETFSDVPEAWKTLWARKADVLLRNRENETIDSIYGRAGIYAEFGKIVCISCGLIPSNGGQRRMVIKSFYGDEEQQVLAQFCDMLGRWAAEGDKFLCAHNGKEFDFPYLCRRLVILGMCLPAVLTISGKKPWEVNHIDTMEMWRFGDYKSFTSLNLLSHALGIPSSKDDIDGSQVGDVYWKEHNLQRIVSYCQKDVITVAQVYLRLTGEPLLPEDCIDIK